MGTVFVNRTWAQPGAHQVHRAAPDRAALERNSAVSPIELNFDIVTVFHNEINYAEHLNLLAQMAHHLSEAINFIPVNNQVENRGFAPACNLGAAVGGSPIIGFLNPDVTVYGDFTEPVLAAFDEFPDLVITGERFGKPQSELATWGCADWVCGACFFVKRKWWESVGGFDESYKWGWEETDLVRLAQSQGLRVRSIPLPVSHSSPIENSPEDAEFKRVFFNKGANHFRRKWL